MSKFAFVAAVVPAMLLAAGLGRADDPAPQPIKAADLTKEFAKDEKATKAKYGNKPIVVEGKVVAVEAKPDKAATITLAGHNETDKEPIRVTCYFPEDLAETVKKVEKGATVKVKGEFGPESSLFLKEIDLDKCSLVE